MGNTDLVKHAHCTNWGVEAHRGRLLPKITQLFRGRTGSKGINHSSYLRSIYYSLSTVAKPFMRLPNSHNNEIASVTVPIL